MSSIGGVGIRSHAFSRIRLGDILAGHDSLGDGVPDEQNPRPQIRLLRQQLAGIHRPQCHLAAQRLLPARQALLTVLENHPHPMGSAVLRQFDPHSCRQLRLHLDIVHTNPDMRERHLVAAHVEFKHHTVSARRHLKARAGRRRHGLPLPYAPAAVKLQFLCLCRILHRRFPPYSVTVIRTTPLLMTFTVSVPVSAL